MVFSRKTPKVFPEVSLRRKSWLLTFLRSVTAEIAETGEVTAAFASHGCDRCSVATANAADDDAWVHERLRELGFYYGTARPDTDSQRGLARRIFLETLARQVQLIWELRCRLRPDDAATSFALELAVILGGWSGQLREAEHLRDVLTDVETGDSIDDDRIVKRFQDPGRAIGAVLKRSLLDDDHPLLDKTFHRLLIYCDTRLLVRIARLYYTGPVRWDADVLRAIGETQVAKLCFIEAIIGLSWADGKVDPMEDRLVTALIKMGAFEADEVRMLRRQLKGQERPRVETIAEGIADPINRRFILEQTIFAGLVDGEMTPEEEAFIDRLSDSLDFCKDELITLQLETVAFYDTHPELLRGLSVAGMVSRMRKNAQNHAEAVVRENLHALVTEVKETGDLMQLLIKSTQETLTEDEQARVRQQLLDIAKTIPSLALIAAPGGTILVPIMIKLVPFSLMPSAFEEQDEKLT